MPSYFAAKAPWTIRAAYTLTGDDRVAADKLGDPLRIRRATPRGCARTYDVVAMRRKHGVGRPPVKNGTLARLDALNALLVAG